MAEQLQPESLASVIADIDRRLRNIETTSRLGIAGLRAVWQTAGASPTVFGSFETGTVGNTWADDAGATGTGYPTLTLTTGRRYMLLWSARPIGIATAATYKSASALVSVRIDGVDNPPLPSPRRQFANGNAAPVDAPLSAIVVRQITPGTHTFQVSANWSNDQPAAPNLPTLTDTFLAIIPLSSS